MKQRVISAIVVFALAIPIFLIGGNLFKIAFYILTLLALKEFMSVREKEKKYPDFIRFISYTLITFLYFGNILNKNNSFIVDYKLISSIFLIILMGVVLYHDKEKYNVEDAFYLLGGILFLGFSMPLFFVYRSMGLKLIIFLFLITVVTDSYAYFGGILIGKNKLLESVSPKKTWEGTITGSLVGTFVCTVYYLTVINSDINIFKVISVVLFLSIVGQFGDLFFSAIKRMYGVKDYSNIMPGHGGILDRLDSILFVLLMFTFFVGGLV